MELSGRSVFITGGAQGIGKAMTKALLQRGAKVLFCDINAQLGTATERELQKKFGADNVIFQQCDVTDADQLKAAFDRAVKQFGAVEICCNNAGIMDERIWEKMLAVNTTAQIRGSQIAFEHMRRDKGGRGGVIVNNVAIAGLYSGYELPLLVASKHAMIGYTTSMARDPDMPAMGVRWVSLCPVAVNTDMLQFKGGEVKDHEKYFNRIKPQVTELEDVVAAFLKLLEDTENNGKMMVVEKGVGGVYRRRMLVGDDGKSNPVLVDKPLTQHPPVPGPLQ